MCEERLDLGEVEVEGGWDVVVAGGGPAGCAAATAAARGGARTLLIEATGRLGGAGTSGLVPAWCPFTDGERVIYGGLAERVFFESKEAMPHVRGELHGWLPLDPERLARIYDDLVLGAGAEVRFGTMLCGVEARGGRVEALVTAGKGGLRAAGGQCFVDATGDGDLCAWAGAEFEMGDERGETMPATLCFILANVCTYAYHFNGLYKGDGSLPFSPARRIVESGRYPRIRDRHLCCNLIGPGVVGFNAGHMWDVDATDPASVSRAMAEGRRIAADFRDALAEFDPAAFGGAHLVLSAPLLGVRESRRVLGDYVFSVEDYLARRSFDDEICRNAYLIDIHVSKAEVGRSAAGERVVANRFEPYRPGESHGIPYRCLTPLGLRNVLVAGRCVSTDRTTQGSVRVMPTCLAMGEAAGVAAATAARMASPDVRALDVAALREALRGEGAYLP